MESLQSLLDRNVAWSERMVATDPQYFRRLVAQQAPQYLWIGCSDARVPANEIVDLAPGELFVHRNVANVVAADDANAQAVIEFAVDVLKVKHVIVCGHYGCGGVQAALHRSKLGLVDNWLRHVQDVASLHRASLDRLDDEARLNRLCELNVIEQARNVCGTTIVQDAWARGQALSVHAWIYGLSDGLLRDLAFTGDAPTGNPPVAIT